jgi:hypothetical protein
MSSVEIKVSSYNEPFIFFKKNQRSKVKRLIHRTCPPLLIPRPLTLNILRLEGWFGGALGLSAAADLQAAPLPHPQAQPLPSSPLLPQAVKL